MNEVARFAWRRIPGCAHPGRGGEPRPWRRPAALAAKSRNRGHRLPRQPAAGAGTSSATVVGRRRRDPGRGHRQVPRPEPVGIDPAHPRRRPGPRRAAKAASISVRGLGPQLHPRAHQRHGSADHRRAAPTPTGGTNRGRALRLQRLRLGPVQRHHRAQDGRRPPRKKARWARPSTCAPPAPFDYRRLQARWARPRPATTTWPSSRARAARS